MGNSYSTSDIGYSTVVHVSKVKMSTDTIAIQFNNKQFIHIGTLYNEDYDCIVKGVTLFYYDNKTVCRQVAHYQISFDDYQSTLDYVASVKSWILSNYISVRKIIIIQPFDDFKTLNIYMFFTGKHKFPFKTPNIDVGYVV
tara:strand:+ start:18741 stop:19163 length:423 start_codon:yes stop_codon:yes gene_type:complete